MRITKQIKEEMLARLEKIYHGTKSALNFSNSFELLIAVILSAQCTDARVNITTGRLFKKADTPEKILQLGLSSLAEEIRDCGLFHSKAKNIFKTCQKLCSEYNSQVPDDYDALLSLPGVGRKTANVVSSIAFGRPAIAVDTHVFRVANRLKLAVGDSPEKVEKELQKAIPVGKWSDAHHWLIWHGRKICRSRHPLCQQCFLNDLCPSALTMETAVRPDHVK